MIDKLKFRKNGTLYACNTFLALLQILGTDIIAITMLMKRWNDRHSVSDRYFFQKKMSTHMWISHGAFNGKLVFLRVERLLSFVGIVGVPCM